MNRLKVQINLPRQVPFATGSRLQLDVIWWYPRLAVALGITDTPEQRRSFSLLSGVDQ